MYKIHRRSAVIVLGLLVCSASEMAAQTTPNQTVDATGSINQESIPVADTLTTSDSSQLNSPVKISSPVNLTPRVYYVAADQHVHELASVNGKWFASDVFTRTAEVAPPTAVHSPLVGFGVGNTLAPRVYYAGTNGHIWELAWIQSKWHAHDLFTNATGTPTDAAANSSMAAFGVGSTLAPRVYYVRTNGHVCELAWFQSAWHASDLFALTAQPAATILGAKLVAFGAGTALAARVYYVGTNGTLWELAWFGNKWHASDLEPETQLPVPGRLVGFAVGTDPLGDNPEERVYYGAKQEIIWEVAWFKLEWHASNITELARFPESLFPAASRMTGFAVGESLSPRLYYEGSSGTINELAWYNHRWYATDLFTRTAEPAIGVLHGSVLAGFGAGTDFEPRVYYVSAGGHICELAWVKHTWHASDVFTEAAEPPAQALPSNALIGFGTVE